MPNVVWNPDTKKPRDASSLEAEIRRVAPGAEVKLTLVDDGWLVRALAPAALCSRGSDFSGRDLSEAIAHVLNDNDCPARARPR